MVPQPKKLLSFSSPLFFVLAAHAAILAAQPGPQIVHDEVKCILAGQHLILQAVVEPADTLTTVKVYFRASLYPQFYYVEMTRVGDVYQGVLPRPSPQIDGIHYYLEAVDATFDSIRTGEYTPQVVTDESQCREKNPTPVMYLDGPGAITVGATGAGPALPAGFLPEGIVGTITAAGRAASGGGGGALLIGGLAAGGAAAAAGILVSGGDDGQGTTTTVTAGGGPPMTTSIPPATTSIPSTAPVVACFDTSPSPPTINVGGSVRFDASCSQPAREQIASYKWEFNDGRAGKEGRVVNRVYDRPGTFTAELTVTAINGTRDSISQDVIVHEQTAGPTPSTTSTTSTTTSTTTTVPGNADLAVTGFSGPANIVTNTNATYTINYANNGPDFDPSVSVNTTFSPAGGGSSAAQFVGAPGCGSSASGNNLVVSCFIIGGLGSGAGGAISITVQYPSTDTYFVNTNIQGGTSDPNPGNNGAFLSTAAALRADDGAGARKVGFVSHVDGGAPGAIQGTVALNGTEAQTIDNASPVRLQFQTGRRRNFVDGHAAGGPLGGVLWRFDFSQSEGFEAGSLRVERGNVVTYSPYGVVFRLDGGARRIRFSFRLARRR